MDADESSEDESIPVYSNANPASPEPLPMQLNPNESTLVRRFFAHPNGASADYAIA
jgi:hypothetical protein